MSRRPTDWSPLAGSDPVPGDPDEVERAAKSLADMAEEITRQTANLTRLATAGGWDAEAGRTFADSAGSCPVSWVRPTAGMPLLRGRCGATPRNCAMPSRWPTRPWPRRSRPR